MGCFNLKSSAILLASLITVNAPAVLAQNASDLLSTIKASKAVGAGSVQVASLSSQTIVTLGDDNGDSLHNRAVAVAKLVAEDKDNIKPLTVLFTDKGNKVKEVCFKAADLSQLAAGSSDITTDIHDAEAAVETRQAAPAAISQSSGQYQTDRAKVVARIEALKAKGVGVSPFVQELTNIDDVYSHGRAGEAIASLTGLDDKLTEQEKFRKQMQVAAAARQTSRIQPVSYSGQSGHVSPSVAPAVSVADYHGSLDGFVTEMLNAMVVKEVGQWMPHRGPFLVERFRIAKRIHELEGRVRIDGYANLFRNMEDVVAAKDSRRLQELCGDIRYLQAQLGLPQLEGGLHQRLGAD